MTQLTVISLGWGVQSWTLAAMVALGELPPVDFAVHSDTTWERSSTYAFAAEWMPWLETHGVRVVTVSDPDIAGAVVDNHGGLFIPAYTLQPEHIVVSDGRYAIDENEDGDLIYEYDPEMDGKEIKIPASKGQLRRQCTNRWKIQPMRRYISTQLKSKTPGAVEQWLGITLDEYQRAKDSDVQYIKHRFPLLEMNYSRADCLAWLERHGLPSPGKSACTFCPYHNRITWERMKREDGHDWRQAVDVDARIRDKRPPYPLFVHPARVPLPEAVRIPEDYGAEQLSFLASDDEDAECDSGYCFL